MSSPSSARRNAAQICLDELAKEAEEKQTMAAWRLSDPMIRQLLEEFAVAPEFERRDPKMIQQHVQSDLFLPLNKLLWKQEQTLGHPFSDEVNSLPTTPQRETVLPISIVFGGKYAKEPQSISECMVKLLSECGHNLITVSRSQMDRDSLPSNVRHIAKKSLDQSGGEVEFYSVLEQCWEEAKKQTKRPPINIYFTLGQHKGEDPFRRNIVAARNFAKALEELIITKKSLPRDSLRIILTGTDATLPSTHTDGVLSVGMDGEKTLSLSIPTYKILPYNFVYAMSKLCQFYIIAHTVSRWTHLEEKTDERMPRSLEADIDQMTEAIERAGENGNYDPSHGVVTIPQLDEISRRWSSIESALSPHLKVAQGISICYTPLHAKPWTEASLVKCDFESRGSPRGFLLQQVVRRMKNAISIDLAARKHFQ